MSPTVDIFIPTISNHMPYIKRALGSVSFQDYNPLRIVLWVEDPCVPQVEDFLNNVWYEPDERKPSPKAADTPVTVEYCKKGVLARNFQGRTGTAWRARDWIFNWGGKSDYIKMLDCDDILTPSAITVMMKYMTEDIDAVFCPLTFISSSRVGEITKDQITGAGQMLMRKETINKINELGFKWNSTEDIGFYKFFKAQNFKYVITKENALYLYIKG